MRALAERMPAEAGLAWQECAVRSAEPDWHRSGGCAFYPSTATSVAAPGITAVKTADGYLLHTAAGVFATHEYVLPGGQRHLYVLTRNGLPLQVFVARLAEPNASASLTEVGDAVVWEFTALDSQTVVANGQDVRGIYGLEAAYAPIGLNGKLIFIAKQAEGYFVVYDGQRVGPIFDRILIANCCDPFGYSAHGGNGQYTFWGWRGQQLYSVVIQAHT